MKIKLLVFALLFSVIGWGQVTMANYKFENNLTVEAGSIGSPTLTASAAVSYFGGVTGNAVSYSAATGKYLELVISTTGYNSIDISFAGRSSGTGSTWVVTGDSTGGTTFSAITSLTCPNGSFGNLSTTLLGAAYDNKTSIRLRFTCGGTSATVRMDDLLIRGISSSPAPILAITPATTNLGTSCVGTPTTPVVYTITNSGTVAATGVTVVSSGANNTNFVVSGLSSTSIPASGGTATYTVTFTPSAAGARVATITVASTTSGSNSPTTALTGTGTATITPIVTSAAATAILDVSATLNGNVTTLGVCPATITKGFVYSETAINALPTDGGTGVTTTAGVAVGATGAYNAGIAGLTNNTNYTYRAYVFDGTTYTYSAIRTFTTLGVPVVSNGSFSGTAGTAITTFNLSTLSTNTPTSYAITGGALPSGLTLNTTTGAITGTPTVSGSFSITFTATNGIGTSSPAATVTITINPTQNSDIVSAGGEPATISSTNNTATISSITDGVQVWSFTIRDGGVSSDADLLSTTLTDLTISQGGGNSIAVWTDAIQSVALFDGSTFVANGTVNAGNIVFSSLSGVVAPDNGIKTLTMRLSLKCPLGATALDGNDFDFSITPANTTFLATGSGKNTGFAVASTPDNTVNFIAVVASRILFTTQPATTGVNNAMTNVVVTATDACGNKDIGFTGTVSLTSTGTMTGTPLTATAVAGVATFTGILHTVIGTGLTMNAAAAGVTSAISTTFDIVTVTVLQRGDLAILSVNTNLGGVDQMSFVCFQDITPGTTFYFTDNGYQSALTNKWGSREGVLSITRTGTTLPKGTIITYQALAGNVMLAINYDIYTCGVIDNNWTKSNNFSPSGAGFDLNLDDDVWIMQGGIWNDVPTDNSTYTGTVLYGWTESGWNTSPNSACTNSAGADPCTKRSTIYPGLECYNTVAPVGAGKVKFNDPVNPDFSTLTNGKLDWIALINTTANWDTYATDILFNAGGYDYKGNVTCTPMTIANVGYVNGKWTGRSDTNWFNCGNWDTLVVPDATVDVQIGDNTFNNQAIVDATAPQSDYYGDIAQARNLTITGEKVEVTTAMTNILEVHGDLLIDAPAGALDMNAGGATDGHLQLYGNWTNNMGSAAFDEGNGTVTFTGTAPQIINNVTPEGTETFHHLILNNNFDTNVSNDIIATGDLTVNATKTLTVSPNDYAEVTNAVLNSGTVTIENNGSLVQINDGAINTGTITARRNASQRLLDYVYWSAPVSGFNLNYFNTTGGTSYIYQWNPIAVNPNGGEGNWGLAAGAMTPGRGYIVRGNNAYNNTAPTTWTANFSGPANNGVIPVTVSRGNDYTGAGTQGLPRTAQDDNWNLIGNPYPSAIDVLSTGGFLDANPDLEGFIKIWTHGTLPSSTIDPFYQNFVLNYFGSDYITLNRTGLISGPGDYKVGSGQGFFVLMDPGAAGSAIVNFNNSMRSRNFTNNQFYKTSNSNSDSNVNSAENWNIKNSRSRIWLDLISSTNVSNRTLVGYVLGATNDKDRMYDATTTTKPAQHFYSVINNELVNIQGRSLPFKMDDFVPMGIKVPTDGNYKIAIAAVDGVFANKKQKIYLEDKELGIIHDLTNAPYDFTTSKGIYNDRFVIRYKDKKATEVSTLIKANDIIISSSENQIQIMSNVIKITNYEIYNVLGQSIAMKNDVNTNKVTETSIQKNNQALLIKIQLENGQTVVKKIIF